MSDYKFFPEYRLFKKCLQYCPTSALIYATIHASRKNQDKIRILKDEVKDNLLMSPTVFRSHMRALARNELIEFEEKQNSFMVFFSK